MCSDALEQEPECVPLLLIRARAHIALRRDLDAQADLRDVIRLDPECAPAFRLLGELAARRDENGPAAVFFREALRLDPGDREAADWLLITDASIRPAAVASKIPAPATAAGRFSRETLARSAAAAPPARFARGTRPPHEYEERPTRPYKPTPAARGSGPVDAWKTPSAVLEPAVRTATLPLGDDDVIALDVPKNTLTGRPPTSPPAKSARAKPIGRTPITELPGFGEYLVASGILTRERLRAAQAYQRSMKVQLSTAIVTLGLATPQRIEWASVAHQSQVAGLV